MKASQSDRTGQEHAIALTVEEKELLTTTLQAWEDGLEVARDEAIRDTQTLNTPAKLLDVTASYDTGKTLIQSIRKKVLA